MPTELISIVVPAFNEQDNLPELVARLTAQLDTIAPHGWEVVLVDDGSTDGTRIALRELNARDARFKAVLFSRNFGKEIAIAAGLRYAAGDAVIVMDADLQHPPEMLGEFLTHWRQGHEVVYGQRRSRETDGPIRRFFSRRFYRLFHVLTPTELPEGAGDFRLLDRKAVAAMNRIGERNRYNNGLFAWIGFRSIGIPYRVAERTKGTSSWSFLHLARFAIDGIASFSTVPLRIWSYLGLLISVFALGYAMLQIIETLLYGPDVPGFPTLAVSIMFFSGVQLISLGVLGEYLGRVYEEVKARPLFLVADEIGLESRATETRTSTEGEHATVASAPETGIIR